MLKKNRIVMLVTAVGLGLGMGWVLAAQQAAAPAGKEPQWKDRAEYDLAVSIDAQKSPADALKVIKEWETKYPQTDFLSVREDAFLAVYKQLNDFRNAFETAKKIRTRQPENLLAIDAVLTLVYNLGTPIPAADLTYAEQTGRYALGNLSAIFAPTNKPRIMDEKSFPAYRPSLELLAQRIVAYAPYQKEQWANAETEIKKFLGMDGTQAQFSQMLGRSMFEQRQADPGKQAPAIYHFARAAAYTGKNELPAAAKQQVLTYVTNTYTAYHCGKDGLDQLLAQAKASVMPPPGFSIKSCVDIEKEKIESDNKWKEEHPDLAFWRDAIRAPLQSEGGAGIFSANFLDAELPPPNIGKFTGTIVSSTQEKGNTKQVVVAVFEPNVADTTLNFIEAMPGTPNPGEVIKFKGAAKSFVREPFNLTLEVDPMDVEGWTATAPANTGKGGAKGKGGPKGKQAK